jgi:hypothetical protein
MKEAGCSYRDSLWVQQKDWMKIDRPGGHTMVKATSKRSINAAIACRKKNPGYVGNRDAVNEK